MIRVSTVPADHPIPDQVAAELAAAGIQISRPARRLLDRSILCRLSMRHDPDRRTALCRDCALPAVGPLPAAPSSPPTHPCVLQEA